MKSDIKDFEPAGVACLGSGQPWVGMGKHLCGAATDFALLCMARNAVVPSGRPLNGAKSDTSGESFTKAQPRGFEDHHQDTHSGRESRGARAGLQGFGIATCCHHRCSWAHYVGRDIFQRHGMSEQDFQLVTWMTGTPHCVPISCL